MSVSVASNPPVAGGWGDDLVLLLAPSHSCFVSFSLPITAAVLLQLPASVVVRVRRWLFVLLSTSASSGNMLLYSPREGEELRFITMTTFYIPNSSEACTISILLAAPAAGRTPCSSYCFVISKVINCVLIAFTLLLSAFIQFPLNLFFLLLQVVLACLL